MFLFIIIQFFFFLLPLLFFFIYKRKNKEKIVRVIYYYILYCIFQEIITYAVSFSYGFLRQYLIYVFASYTIIEFCLFALFYYYLFPAEHRARQVVKFVAVAFTLFALADFAWISKNQSFDSFVSGIEALILILLCGYYLYYQVTHTMTMAVYRTFNFWIIVTFLLYISSTFFLYLMTDTMGGDPEFQKYYLIINFGANIFKNLLLCYAISRKHVLSPETTAALKPEFTLDLGDDLILQENI